MSWRTWHVGLDASALASYHTRDVRGIRSCAVYLFPGEYKHSSILYFRLQLQHHYILQLEPQRNYSTPYAGLRSAHT
jgi:hypothetical protein